MSKFIYAIALLGFLVVSLNVMQPREAPAPVVAPYPANSPWGTLPIACQQDIQRWSEEAAEPGAIERGSVFNKDMDRGYSKTCLDIVWPRK